MRTGGVTIRALLLVLATTVLQVSAVGDNFWEGEEDNLNEFLEVKNEDAGVIGHLERFKRQFDFMSIFNAENSGTEGDDGSVDEGDTEPRENTTFCEESEFKCDEYRCLPISAKCNGQPDCSDYTDEQDCPLSTTFCEESEFQCDEYRCLPISEKCNGQEDCSDGTDEQDCPLNTTFCEESEFKCDEYRCLPISAKCNGQPDCSDGTDEQDCPLIPVSVKSPPKPQNVKLNPGDTLTLRCELVGVPVPPISWRFNLGHVPSKCTWTSDNGISELTCLNMQPNDSGAYSCETMNNEGTTFATPEAIVFVNKTDLCGTDVCGLCPRGYFNNGARSESECIRCFCFGKSSQCRSADLFTYMMPTPLGEGGTKLVGIEPSRVYIDTQPISNQYYYQPLRNGASVTKFGHEYYEGYNSYSRPYLALPESYNGNQLKSYGARIKYTLSPHTQAIYSDVSAATIIIKGKYGNLFHMNRSAGTANINIEARLTPEDWSRHPDGSIPTEREHIMMVLYDIEMILLRAGLNNAGVNITDFVMESAEDINVGLGAATLVEECTCSKGYEGLSCQKCAAGFARKRVGPFLGDCGPEECPPGTYGDPSSGLACRPCPCPDTNTENQFVRTCSLRPDGSVICDCFTGYDGLHCEVCAPDYEGNPLVPGDNCRLKQSSKCNIVGTKTIISDVCMCKDNVQGRYCDQCKNKAFFLSSDFRHGCADCFCSGLTQQCTSSNYRRKTISVQFNVPQIVDQLKIYNSAPVGRSSDRYSVPKETKLRPQIQRGEIFLNNVESASRFSVYYWSMPLSFAGNKVTAYGGYLRYVLKDVPSSVNPKFGNTTADVQLISDNKLIFHYFGHFGVSHDRTLNASIQLLEKGWQRPDGSEVTRAMFLLALAEVKTILIKTTYAPGPQLASPVSASIEIAELDAYGPVASHVEHCDCPPGYIGTSCEDCMPGYTRFRSSLYYGVCDFCQCSGKSTMCHAETGECYECADNTAGPQCESCKPGFERDGYGSCVPIRDPSQTCNCDPRGTAGSCDSSGKCKCKQYVEGHSCDRCKPGTFGLEANNPDGCLPCYYCSGVSSECYEVCIKCPPGYSGTSCETCDSGYYKDERGYCHQCTCHGHDCQLDSYGQVVCNCTAPYTGNDCGIIGNSTVTDPTPIRPPPPEETSIVIIDSPKIQVLEVGRTVTFSCMAQSRITSTQLPVKWIKKNGNLPLERTQQYNGILKITNLRVSDSGVYVCETKDEITIGQAETTLKVHGNEIKPSVKISPSVKDYYEGESVALECKVAGNPTPTITWQRGADRHHNTHSRPMPLTAIQLRNFLIIKIATVEDSGEYRCIASNVIGTDDRTATIRIHSRLPLPAAVKLGVSNISINVNEGQNISIVCSSNVPAGSIDWVRQDNALFTSNVRSNNGVLYVEYATPADQGVYICQSPKSNLVPIPILLTVVVKNTDSEDYKISTSVDVLKIPTGGRGTVDCSVTGRPVPLIKWTKIHGPFGAGTSQRGNTLVINNPQESDQGYYLCEAIVNNNPVVYSYVDIVIEKGSDDKTIDPDGPNNPSIGDNGVPSKLYAVEGQPETVIYCNQSGNGRVIWTRPNHMPMERHILQSESRLLILNVSKRDSGQYVCNIYNEYGQIQDTVYTSLVVVTAPRISLLPSVQTIQPGQSPTVECVVDGDDIFDVTWTRYNNAPSRRMEVHNNLLKFHEIEVDDAGEYQCTARSPFGKSTAIAEVIVSGYECLESEFRCYDYSGCIDQHLLCDGRKHCQDNSDEENCLWRDKLFSETLTEPLRHHGSQVTESEKLVYIEQPPRAFRVGDNVNVLCVSKKRPGDVQVQWLRPGTNEYVTSVPYGDGAMLSIQGVTVADAGVYRCVGRDSRYGRDSFDDFELRIESGNLNYPGDGDNIQVTEYTAYLRSSVDLPCNHDLEPPVNIEWSREYSPLPSELRSNQPYLHLDSVTEADAGIYICRVSNNNIAHEFRAVFTVKGVVPMFNGEGYIALPSLKEMYMQFNIEISFRPTDENGLILYNSQDETSPGVYIALQLKDGVPEFILNTGYEPVKKVISDRPLQLNKWHTIRLCRTATEVTMDVDNSGPFVAEIAQFALLELENQPLFIGGVGIYDDLPVELAGASGFIGCVSMLVLDREEKNIMLDNIDQYRITECNSCSPNLCLNNGFCQEAHNERGCMCICAPGFAGQDCDRTGKACRPGLCGPGKCTDTATGYKCACPVTHTGTNCETKRSIEYPSFTGSAYLAIKPPGLTRTLKISMNIKAASPITDGIIMYWAESPRGYGGFTLLAVHNRKLEFRFHLGKGIPPVILVNNKTLTDNAWTNVHISRIGSVVSLKIDSIHSYEQNLPSPYNQMDLSMETPIFVGGVDDSITLNKNVGVSGGFNGCIKDFAISGQAVDIVNQTIKSANVQECVTHVRGGIPEDEKLVQCQCRNGGRCISETEPTVCSCTSGFTGQLCEDRIPSSMREINPFDPCYTKPCTKGGTCRPDGSATMNFTCDCQLGYAGSNCQIELRLYESVGFNGNGYLVLPPSELRYNLDIEPALIAMAISTTRDGILFYQGEELPNFGDYIMLRIERGVVILEWELGSGRASIAINEEIVTDGERHVIIAKLMEDGSASLSVDSHQKTGSSTGIMNVDSNIYIGGVPEHLNAQGYPGFSGCIGQIELMESKRGLNLGKVAVAGRNAQRCKNY